jgi:hypothetical protein
VGLSTGFWLVNGFIDNLHTRLGITSSYSATANLPTIHKSPQHPLSLFPDCSVFTSRSSATTSNSRDSSASRSQVLSKQPSVQNCLSTDNWLCPLLIISQPRPRRNTPFPTVTLLSRAYLLPQERVYRTVAWKRSFCFLSHLLTAGLYATISKTAQFTENINFCSTDIWPFSLVTRAEILVGRHADSNQN